MTNAVELSLEQGVAVLTLNRPEHMNTFNSEMMQGMNTALRRCADDDSIRCVVITGAGKAFCAGADLSGGGDTFDSTGKADISSCPLDVQPWDLPKPVIAACNGHAVGIGMGIATQCDMRVLAEEGKYGFLQNRRGVVADCGVSWLLPRLVGFERAFELLVRAQRLSGAEALEIGLASRCVPAANVLSTAMDIATDIAANCAPLVSGLHKDLLWKGMGMDRNEAVLRESQALNHSMRLPDALEGGVAYFEKRAPEWTASPTDDWPENF